MFIVLRKPVINNTNSTDSSDSDSEDLNGKNNTGAFDLTPAEQSVLSELERRKAELLLEIGKIQDEIEDVLTGKLSTQPSQDEQQINESHTHEESHVNLSSFNTPLHLTPHFLSWGGTQTVPSAKVERDDEKSLGSDSVPGDEAAGKTPSRNSFQAGAPPPSSSASTTTSTLMSLGCKKFNMDPKKGIEFLISNGLISSSNNPQHPEDIAKFLYSEKSLNKSAIGDYLGEKSELNEKVLTAFVDLHDFTDVLLVQALRQFLRSFRLPGEAQKIDRFMDCFAKHYCECNAGIFAKKDTCYVLSFAIIMLNTNLHNPAVKKKQSVDDFISMIRGVNDGVNLNRDLLESFYASIQAEPFKLPNNDDNDLFLDSDKEGWLIKQSARYKTWKRRWFVLKDNCLYYFETSTDKTPRGIIPLKNVSVREVVDKKSDLAFEIYASGPDKVIKACKTDSAGKIVEGKQSSYRMMAKDEEEKISWVRSLNNSIFYSPWFSK